jgi:hypothetical protein
VNRDEPDVKDITWLPRSLFKGDSIVKIISIDGKQQDDLFGFLRMNGEELFYKDNNIKTKLSTLDEETWPISSEDEVMSYDELQQKYAPKIIEQQLSGGGRKKNIRNHVKKSRKDKKSRKGKKSRKDKKSRKGKKSRKDKKSRKCVK